MLWIVKMSTNKKVVYIDKARQQASGASKAFSIFKVIHKLVIDKISVSVNQVFNSVDDTLFNLAEKASTSNDHQNYFSSMRDVRSKKKEAINKYCKLITQANQAFLAKEGEEKPTSQYDDVEDELSLIEHNQLEQTLAIENIISKVNLRSSKDIAALEARLGDLFPDKFIDEDSNPLSPKNLTSNFFTACHEFEVDEQSQLIISKLFDKVMAKEFQELYSQVNRILVKNGVLPDLKSKKKNEEAKPNHEQETERKQPSSAKESSEALSGEDEDLINVLYELLAQRRGEKVDGDFTGQVQASPPESKIQVKSFIDSLSHIQTERFHSQHNGVESADSIKSYISKDITKSGAAASPYSQIQSDTIDIVSMLFEFILGDSNIPNNIKALIGRLQIPVLKVAVIDSTFFNRPNHPARALINELAGAAIGVQSSSLASQDQLLQKTEAIVNKILTEFTDNVSIFDDLLLDLHEFQKLEKQRADAIEKKTRDAEESKVKVENSKETVRTEIETRIQNSKVPASISDMVRDAWSKYLFICHLKSGDEGDSFIDGLQTIDNLIWSLSPKDNEADKTRLLSLIPKIQRELREGLNNILFNPFEITKIFQNLEKLHIDTLTATNDLITGKKDIELDSFIDPQPAASTEQNNIKQKLHSLRTDMLEKKHIRQKATTISEDTSTTTTEIPLIDSETSAPTEDSLDSVDASSLTAEVTSNIGKDSLSQAEDISFTAEGSPNQAEGSSNQAEGSSLSQRAYNSEYLEKVDEIDIGTWFEFTQDNNEKIRAKLSARLRNGERLIFVNRSGFKMAEKSSEQLAHEIESGITEVLNDSLLFDRALESVITNLKQIKSDKDKVHQIY